MATGPAKHILIIPLDWGLGHTIRCIPVIRHLLACGHKVTAAGNQTQLTVLTANCPGIDTVLLDGYNVRYSRSRQGFMWLLLRQLPRLKRRVKEEYQWLLRFAEEQKIDGILSDNRYGLYHPRIPSVMLTHQLQVKTGFGNLCDRLLQKIHYRYLRRFQYIWVVDTKGVENLAGSLSHPAQLLPNMDYIGWLSQLQPPVQLPAQHLLVLLSGPEPQRSILSDQLWQQVLGYKGKVVFVEGTARKEREAIPAHIQWYPRLSSGELQPLMAAAAMVICRSGYSTLMDLLLLDKKAILIPTPGQTEQEYLGRHLQEQKIFLSYRQESFRLEKALEDAAVFPFKPLTAKGGHTAFIPVLEKWMATL